MASEATKERMTAETETAEETMSETTSANASQAASHVKMPAVSSLLAKERINRSAENRLARVAEALKTSDVHAEMASGLVVNLTDRKTGIVRFEEKGTKH